eukprot:11126007-Heterocapsa_arctica.AAC.1
MGAAAGGEQQPATDAPKGSPTPQQKSASNHPSHFQIARAYPGSPAACQFHTKITWLSDAQLSRNIW